jgi:hypothetical protein
METFAKTHFTEDVSRRTFVAGLAAGLVSLPIPRAWADEPAPKRDPGANDSAAAAAQKGVRPPEFKRWPPHGPSARYVMVERISRYQNQTQTHQEDGVLTDLAEDLQGLGYLKLRYFALSDGGFAIAAPFERINPDASPAKTDRFNLEPTFKENFLGRKLIPRHLRAMVFFLTPYRFTAGQWPTDFLKHRKALEAGISSFGKGVQFSAITPQHRLTAFLYLYAAEGTETPVFVTPEFALAGFDQLRASRII